MKEDNYKYLLGKEIIGFKDLDDVFVFYTDDEEIIIDKFIPYCACNVGEYIDEITYNGKIKGVITDVTSDIRFDTDEIDKYDETVYKGRVSFYFENGKVNMNVHGEDNGFYGVQFTMPVTIIKREKKK